MKPHTLPVKRRPVQKGILRRLSAVTSRRKQHVAATAEGDMELDDSSSRISRALTIIFLIHIVAIGLIFVHQKFLDGRTPEADKAPVVSEKDDSRIGMAPQPTDQPRLPKGDKPYVTRAGDNYGRIAEKLGVDEGDLRLINEHVNIGPGTLLRVPPKRPVAPVAETAVATTPSGAAAGDELVDAIDVTNAPRATLVRGKMNDEPRAATTAATKPSASSGKVHVVQSGESIWGISNRYKVGQAALLKANGITDARKIRIGMKLTIP